MRTAIRANLAEAKAAELVNEPAKQVNDWCGTIQPSAQAGANG